MMVTYEQISGAVVSVMRRAKVNDMDSKTIHLRLKPPAPVSMQRLGVVLARMCKEGKVRSCGKKHALTFRLPDASETEIELSDGMKERMQIFEFRPLVSIPRVAPMRDIPAWSRQPL